MYNIVVSVTTTNAVGDSIISGWKKKNWKLLKNVYFPNNEDTIVIENNTYIRKTQKKAKSVTIKTYIEFGFFSNRKIRFKERKMVSDLFFKPELLI